MIDRIIASIVSVCAALYAGLWAKVPVDVSFVLFASGAVVGALMVRAHVLSIGRRKK